MSKSQFNNRILVVGALPPPIGGTTVSFNFLAIAVELNNHYDCDIFEFKSNTNLVIQFFYLIKLMFYGLKYDVISIHANPKRIALWGLFLVPYSKLLNKKIQFRFFGSDLDLFVLENSLNKFLVSIINYSDSILLQTKGLIDFWSNTFTKKSKISWFPTSRPIKEKNKILIKEINSLKLIYVGHLNEEKGIKLLISAFNNMKGDHNILLTLIGSCEDQEMIELIESSNGICYKGEISPNEIPLILEKQHIFVFPSFWKGEGYPGAMIEAMLAGLPIISSNWRYLNELVINDYNGYLVKVNDEKSLTKAINQFINDENKINNFGTNSLDFARKFDSKYWNNKYFELLPLKDKKNICVGL